MTTNVHIIPGTQRPFQPALTRLEKRDGYVAGFFQAMGTPCEVLMDTDDVSLASALLNIAATEAWRIERKFSRYVDGNVVHQINNSGGVWVTVDDETARLLDYADECHRLSDGLFDITSGVLRKAWKFDGSANVPKADDVNKLLPLVGWGKVSWEKPRIRLFPGMEIDLGGIGKEYAVDRALHLMRVPTEIGILVNFGGDIAVGGRRRNDVAWLVGVEDTEQPNKPVKTIEMRHGAVATSGDSKKFVLINGKRCGHILDPRTGWPVEGAPASVTAFGETCSQAGFLSTLGILNGGKV